MEFPTHLLGGSLWGARPPPPFQRGQGGEQRHLPAHLTQAERVSGFPSAQAMGPSGVPGAMTEGWHLGLSGMATPWPPPVGPV